MSRLLLNKLVLTAALLILSISAASAALQCGAKPSCVDLGYSKTHISGCTEYIYCPFDTSYKKCVTARTANNRCNNFALNDCPANANCDYCATAYKIVGCDSGYTLKNNTFVCATACTNKISQSAIPADATAVTESCTACDVSTNIITDWKCNTGYTKVGSRCELTYDSCEKAGYLTSQVVNANCQSHTIYLTNGTQKTCYDKCLCSGGFFQIGNRCEKLSESCRDEGYFECLPKEAKTCTPVNIFTSTGRTICYTECRGADYALISLASTYACRDKF